MSVEPISPEAKELSIKNAATALIASTALKNGLTVAEMPQSAVNEAYAYARSNFESNERKQSNEYYHLYENQKLEIEALKAQAKAVNDNRTAAKDERVVTSMERCRDLMGRATWQQLSTNQRIAAIGVEPQSVDRKQLEDLFGRNASSTYASDLIKTSPYRYRQLREVAKIMNVTGK